MFRRLHRTQSGSPGVVQSTWVGLFLGLATGGVFAGAPGPYAGETLRVLTFFDPQSRALFDLGQEFEKATGAPVVFDQIKGTDSLLADSLAAKIHTYDVVAVDEIHLAELAPHLTPFEDWPLPRVYPPIDLAAVFPETLAKSRIDGRLMGVPINPNLYLYAYRKDLLGDPGEAERFAREYGYPLGPAVDARSLRDLSEFFHRPPDLFGFCPIREVSEALTIDFIWSLALVGHRLADDGHLADVPDEAVIAALDLYRELAAFGPAMDQPDHYEKRLALFREGRLAHAMLWPAHLPDLVDPSESRVADRTGYTPGPRGPGGEGVSLTGFWTIAIESHSRNPRLAAEFASFWLSRPTGVRLMRRGAAPNRVDLLDEEQLARAMPWQDAFRQAIGSTLSRPGHPGYRETSRRLSTILEAFMNDRLSAESAAAAIRAVLAPEGGGE